MRGGNARQLALAHPKSQEEVREAIACDYFVDALDDANFALEFRERDLLPGSGLVTASVLEGGNLFARQISMRYLNLWLR